MENSVTLDLKTYTDLIRENESLKESLKRFKHAFESELDDYFEDHDYTINNMKDKARLKGIIGGEDDVKVLESVCLYVSGIKRVAEKYKGAYSIEDACAYLADTVRATAKDKLTEMEAEGDDEQ